MFTKIMVPVDLAHLDSLQKALTCAAGLARAETAEICYVGVTGTVPGPLGHTPAEYEGKLKAFAEDQAKTHGLTASHKVMIGHDPTTDTDDALMRAIGEVGADLVVMATHKPGVGNYLWPSNGGKLAGHSDVSVFLVRG